MINGGLKADLQWGRRGGLGNRLGLKVYFGDLKDSIVEVLWELKRLSKTFQDHCRLEIFIV